MFQSSLKKLIFLSTPHNNRYRKYVFIPIINEDWKKLGVFDDLPPVEELEARTAIMLLNADYSNFYPEPLQPNMIMVGGLQIKDPKPLSPVSIWNSQSVEYVYQHGLHIKFLWFEHNNCIHAQLQLCFHFVKGLAGRLTSIGLSIRVTWNYHKNFF